MDNKQSSGGNSFWLGLVIGIIVTSLIWGIGKNGKYNGQTAQEWFDLYDEEVAANDDLKNCLDSLPTGDFKDNDTYSLSSDIQDCISVY